MPYEPDQLDKDWLVGKSGYKWDGFDTDDPTTQARAKWRRENAHLRKPSADVLKDKAQNIGVVLVVIAITIFGLLAMANS